MVAAALLATVLVTAGRSSSCGTDFEWRGSTYDDVGPAQGDVLLTRRLGVGESLCLGDAGSPGCRRPREEVTVLAIEGVDPAVAVGAEEYSRIHAVPGYFVQQREHPLHAALYGAEQRKRERRGWTCGDPSTTIGTVDEAPIFVLRLDVEGSEEPFEPVIDSRTRFVGLERRGLAFVPEGARVRVRTLVCTTERGRRKVVAQTVSAADEKR